MLSEAIPLQKAVDRFFAQYPEKELNLDRLLPEDWALLSKVRCSISLFSPLILIPIINP
jgi:hypothetical protein